jgi:hypothetical protein
MVGSQVRCSCADRLVLKCTDCTEAARAGQPVRPTGWGNACAPTEPPAGLAQPVPPRGSANPEPPRGSANPEPPPGSANRCAARAKPYSAHLRCRMAISSVAVKPSPQPREWVVASRKRGARETPGILGRAYR